MFDLAKRDGCFIKYNCPFLAVLIFAITVPDQVRHDDCGIFYESIKLHVLHVLHGDFVVFLP